MVPCILYLRLRNAHALPGLFLGQAEAMYSAGDLDHQPRLDLEFFGIGQAKIGEDIARASFDLEAFNHAFYNVVAPLPALRQPSV